MSGNGVIPNSDAGGDHERQALLKEIKDVRLLKEIFESQHIRGAAFACEVCETTHYVDWDLIVDGLEQNLAHGLAPLHEPAVAPDPEDYVSWDYARGLLDGYESVSLQVIVSTNGGRSSEKRGRR